MSSRATCTPAATHDRARRAPRAVGEVDAGHARAVATTPARGARAAARRSTRAPQRRRRAARVDRVVAGDVEREPDRRRQRGLEPARLRSAAAARPAGRARAGTRAGGRAPRPRRGRARRPACRRRSPGRARASASSAQNASKRRALAQAQLEQRALAELRLGDRREHARGDVPGAGLAGVDARRSARRAARARHAHGEADRAAADDGDVEALAAATWHLPPYAGTTRIRFDGRRPDGALSARLRAPVLCAFMVVAWWVTPSRAPRHRPPVPRLRRPAARSGSRRRCAAASI